MNYGGTLPVIEMDYVFSKNKLNGNAEKINEFPYGEEIFGPLNSAFVFLSDSIAIFPIRKDVRVSYSGIFLMKMQITE